MRRAFGHSATCLLCIAVCGNNARAQAVSAPAGCDDARFLTDQRNLASGDGDRQDLPEHVCGTVASVARARRTRSGRHGYFMLDLGHDHLIRIVSDLDQMDAPAWPWVRRGDTVEVIGRYYYDSRRSQGIDWTHHGTGHNWPVPGCVIVNGTEYQ